MPIYVTGHIHPDLDSVAASIVYANFLKRLKRYEKQKIIPVLPGKANSETIEAFKKVHMDIPKSLDDITIKSNDQFVLVDHNEKVQRHPKVKEKQIVEIIDHHKPNVHIDHPVRIDIEPCGSTSVFIYQIYKTHELRPFKDSAMLMLMAILSDTQGLNSSTTTKLDTQTAHTLSRQLDLNLKEITKYLFEAKENIEGLTPEQIVTRDPKVYEFNKKKIFIGQIETLHPESICEQKEELIKALANLKKEKELDQAYLMITDIGEGKSMMFCPSKKEENVTIKAFKPKATKNPHIFDIGNRMSRKKDIVHEIEKLISNL